MPIPFPALLVIAMQTAAPEQFFAGRTEGTGTINVILSGTSPTRSQGVGRIQPDGSLLLNYVIRQEGGDERRITWRFRRQGNGQYAGTISDARGPVSARLDGNRLHVTYRSNDGNVDQWISFNGDGTATSRTTITRLGMRVATVRETIRRVGN